MSLFCSVRSSWGPNWSEPTKTNGIKGSREVGNSTARSGVGTAATATNGIRAVRDTGTETKKAGIGSAMMAENIERDPRAGIGWAGRDSTVPLTERLQRGTRAQDASRDRLASCMLSGEKSR